MFLYILPTAVFEEGVEEAELSLRSHRAEQEQREAAHQHHHPHHWGATTQITIIIGGAT